MTVRAVLAVFTSKDVLNRRVCEAVLQLMRKYGYVLREIRYAEGDRIKISLNDGAFAELWTGYARPGGYSGAYWTASLFGKGERGFGYLRWHAFLAPHRMEPPVLVFGLRSPITFGFLKPSARDSLDKLARFGHDICVALGATFGYVAPFMDSDDSSYSEPRAGDRVDTAMPGIYWRTFVGKPWLECVRERTRGVEHLDQEESEGVLTLKMDVDPLSPAVLQGSLASRLMQVLRQELFVPGALPQVSYSELEDKAKRAVVCPPEATVDAPWRADIEADLRGRELDEIMATFAARGQEFAERFLIDGSGEMFAHLQEAVQTDFYGCGPPAPKEELVKAFGAYCGELMREDFGGRWAINPSFPGNPGLRRGQTWVYPLGVMELSMSRAEHPGPWLDEYYYAFSEVVEARGHEPIPNLTSMPGRAVGSTPSLHGAQGEKLVEYVLRHHGVKLDYSADSLVLLDSMASELYKHYKMCGVVSEYLGETIRRLAGGRWMTSSPDESIIRIPAAGGNEIDVRTMPWIFDRKYRGMYGSLALKRLIYLPDTVVTSMCGNPDVSLFLP